MAEPWMLDYKHFKPKHQRHRTRKWIIRSWFFRVWLDYLWRKAVWQYHRCSREWKVLTVRRRGINSDRYTWLVRNLAASRALQQLHWIFDFIRPAGNVVWLKLLWWWWVHIQQLLMWKSLELFCTLQSVANRVRGGVFNHQHALV